jgi:predicted nucleic acid-binding protein
MWKPRARAGTSGMPFVMLDTNVVSSLLDPGDALHSQALGVVQDWEGEGCSFAISAIVWSELRVGAIRRGLEAEKALTEFRAEVLDEIHQVEERTADAAARLRARDLTLRVPDALIVATAQEARAAALITADKKLHRIAPDLVELVLPD